ncbi:MULTISPECIES: hypothetical protein [Streptomyces]|uniref:Uncharacterized protein n=1 Tax=Streptomyces siderophoricus TaxID=2802281 RepID=A0ABS1N066_9ACTN|nr:hypothetical protein [Streptomyces sp. 9-7]MBL1093443.1 hypothetical protein [Streptomyces sp. 9-7]
MKTNFFVEFVEGVADTPAWRSQDILIMDTEGALVLLNYGVSAVIHLLVEHGMATQIRTFAPATSIQTYEETKAVQPPV